jgi:hypothetical protein
MTGSTYRDAMFACLLNINQKDMQDIYHLYRVELVKLSTTPSQIEHSAGD